MIKTFTDRYEIAKLLNFGKYPVLSLDLEKDKKYIITGDEDTRYYKGQKVRWKKGDHYWHGDLCYFTDTRQLLISSDNAMITASFGYQDIIKDIEIANAPIIQENSPVVIVIHDSKKRLACVCLADIGDIRDFCSTATTINGDFSRVIKELEEHK